MEEKAGGRGAGPGLQQSKGEDCMFPDRPPTETEVAEQRRRDQLPTRQATAAVTTGHVDPGDPFVRRLGIRPMSADGIWRRIFKTPTQSNRWLGIG